MINIYTPTFHAENQKSVLQWLFSVKFNQQLKSCKQGTLNVKHAHPYRKLMEVQSVTNNWKYSWKPLFEKYRILNVSLTWWTY